jgi:hypothetical protein
MLDSATFAILLCQVVRSENHSTAWGLGTAPLLIAGMLRVAAVRGQSIDRGAEDTIYAPTRECCRDTSKLWPKC